MKEEREETTRGGRRRKRERRRKKKTAFSRASEVACTCRCHCFAHFRTRKRSLEHVRSMICAVRSLSLSTMVSCFLLLVAVSSTFRHFTNQVGPEII